MWGATHGLGAQANECRNPMNARSASTSIAVGLAMTTLQLFAFPFTGACFNPFKALAVIVLTCVIGPTVRSSLLWL